MTGNFQSTFSQGGARETVLSLPRRRPAVATNEPSPQVMATPTREPLDEDVENRLNTAPLRGTNPCDIEARERLLLQLEARLEDRERLVSELETKLRERERDISEAAALLKARERVFDAARRQSAGRPAAGISPEEKAALEALKQELDRQEESLRVQRETLNEREKFLDENETKLFSKMQEHQELEVELEQKAEEQAAREARLMLLSAQASAVSPMQTPAKTKIWDEFKE